MILRRITKHVKAQTAKARSWGSFIKRLIYSVPPLYL